VSSRRAKSDTDITLIHEFKPGTPNERFIRMIPVDIPVECLRQAERRNKILQEERKSIIIGCEKNKIVPDYATNVQTDTSIHSKT